MTIWKVAGGQALGQRQTQEDAFGRLPSEAQSDGACTVMMMVSDGMGGHEGGGIASKVAVAAALQVAETKDLDRTDLTVVVNVANAAIGVVAREQEGLRGMGASFLASTVNDQQVSWVSVGDPLLLRIRGERIERLNDDHSMAPLLDDMARRKEISQKEAESSPRRNQLRSVLTGTEIPLVDLRTAPMAAGDTIIAASDGLLTVPFPLIAKVVSKAPDAQACVEALLAVVDGLRNSTQDNTTILVAMQSPRIRGRATPLGLRTPVPRWRLVLFGAGALAIALVALLVVWWPWS